MDARPRTSFQDDPGRTALLKDAAADRRVPGQERRFAAPRAKPGLAQPMLYLAIRRLEMIAGVVTTKDVLLNWPTIVQDFGLRTWLSCCKAVLTGGGRRSSSWGGAE